MPNEAPIPRLMQAFRRAATEVPAYRELLDEHGTCADQVDDDASFVRHVPLLTRTNTFDRFPLHQLCAGGKVQGLAQVLTSSGHGGMGRFSFGLIDRNQALTSAGFIDQAFDAAFGVKSRHTLAINALPMGVGFSSEAMTVATTSVREDMAVALVQAFAQYYEQIVLVGDPLFMKRLTDHAAQCGVAWQGLQVGAIIGEEVFGEYYRGYLATCLGQSDPARVMASMGVAELGLHLCFETPATIALHRAAFADAAFAQALFGVDLAAGQALPMLYSYDPRRLFIESVHADAQGYGRMTVTTLDTALPVPLMRYQTGDVIRLLEASVVTELAQRHGVALPGALPETLLALQGREKEILPNGSHVGYYKDALYADHAAAARLSGALRLVFDAERLVSLHVQLVPGQVPDDGLRQSLLGNFLPKLQPERLVLWRYERFPFGMSLDYERKFTYYVPGAGEPGEDGAT